MSRLNIAAAFCKISVSDVRELNADSTASPNVGAENEVAFAISLWMPELQLVTKMIE